MNGLQRGAVLVIGLAMLTVITLPDSSFSKGVDAGTRFATGVLGTAMGRGLRRAG